MLITLNQLLRRHRRRLVAMLLALALCCLVVAAHSALGERHMGGDMAVCVAIVQTSALALLAAVAMVTAARRTLRSAAWGLRLGRLRTRIACPAPLPRSRAGPEVLQVFRL